MLRQSGPACRTLSKESPVPLSSLVTRRALHAGAFAAIVGAMAVMPLTQVDAQKGKVSHPAANVTFTDGSTDLARSDLNGTYISGQDGVTATVFMDPNAVTPSGDLVVQFGSSRHFNVTLQAPLGLTGGTGSGPTGTFAADTLFVQAIGFVDVGTTEARVARFANIAGLANHDVGFRVDTNMETFVNGTPVCVYRDSPSSWTIFTTATGPCSGGGETGALFSETTKKGKTVHTFVARYVLPFSVSVQLQ
jgi:hypothetical protein